MKEWSEIVPMACAAYNFFPNEHSRESPFFLMFGRDPRIPLTELCTVPKYHAAVDYTPRLRAPRNLPRCTANSDTREAVANHSPGLATANSYLGMTST